MLLQPLFGLLSDKIGRKPLLIAFGISGALFTIPIMNTLGNTRDMWVACALIMGALIIVSGYTSINAVVKAELFPAEVRRPGCGPSVRRCRIHIRRNCRIHRLVV